jgi:hypothetical protein
MSAPRPPRPAEALLRLILVREDREHALGDLAEEYSTLHGVDGEGPAKRWYWAPPLASARTLPTAPHGLTRTNGFSARLRGPARDPVTPSQAWARLRLSRDPVARDRRNDGDFQRHGRDPIEAAPLPRRRPTHPGVEHVRYVAWPRGTRRPVGPHRAVVPRVPEVADHAALLRRHCRLRYCVFADHGARRSGRGADRGGGGVPFRNARRGAGTGARLHRAGTGRRSATGYGHLPRGVA